MKNCIDQLDREVLIPISPQRIVSLVPSQTEYLFDLGLGDLIIGRTKFCIHPHEGLKSVPIIGGTKNINIESVLKLKPDLVIANKEENVKEQLEELESKGLSVWISDVNTWEDSITMMKSLAEITDRTEIYNTIISKLNAAQSDFRISIVNQKPIMVAYAIWKNPLMFATGNTFINALLEEMGFDNVLSKDFSRYPVIEPEVLQNSNAEFILLSTEPYPFDKSDVTELQNQFPNKKVILINGEFASWYGSRLIKTYSYFSEFRKNLLD